MPMEYVKIFFDALNQTAAIILQLEPIIENQIGKLNQLITDYNKTNEETNNGEFGIYALTINMLPTRDYNINLLLPNIYVVVDGDLATDIYNNGNGFAKVCAEISNTLQAAVNQVKTIQSNESSPLPCLFFYKSFYRKTYIKTYKI